MEVSGRPNLINSHAEEVKKGLHLFVVAMKNLALYPASSQANRLTLAQAFTWFREFFNKYPELSLTVAKDTLTSDEGEIVYQEKPSESLICGPMFRDGLQIITFESGLTEDELKNFLLILNRFHNVGEDEGEDLVTAMWQSSFPNIKYQVADEYAEVDPEFDTTAMRAAKARLGGEELDLPWDALAPLEVEGVAPIAKNLGSLFALASDPSLLSSGSASRGGGGVGGDGPGSGDGSDGAGGGAPGSPADPSGGEGDGEAGALGSGPADPAAEPNYGPGGKIIEDPENNYEEADLSSLSQAFSPKSLDDLKNATPGEWKLETPEGEDNEKRLSFWGLTTEESQQVAALVAWDDSRDPGFSALDVLLTVLSSPVINPQVGTFIINYLSEEIRRSLISLNLKNFNYFWDRLYRESQSQSTTSLLSVIEGTRLTMGRMEILAPLFSSNHPEEKIETYYDDLRYFLYQLPLEAVKLLAMSLGKIQNARLKNLILEVVAYTYTVANTEENLGPILATIPEAAIVLLLRHLVIPGRPLPTTIFNSLTRHPSSMVRAAAAKAMLEHNPALIGQLASLAADPDVTMIFRPYLQQKREPSVEKYLLRFLSDNYSEHKGQAEPWILECYRTLGMCASTASLPFLSEVLLKKSWRTLVNRDLDTNHRLGAALALSLMPNDSEAQATLNKASRSAFRNVRAACQEAQRRLATIQP
ncbi:MAG: hypothetical protein LBR11_07450 [Deltaproteobacteria bacterium]|nr:hypothetical protein [Deltaproteobacteria bacterium]